MRLSFVAVGRASGWIRWQRRSGSPRQVVRRLPHCNLPLGSGRDSNDAAWASIVCGVPDDSFESPPTSTPPRRRCNQWKTVTGAQNPSNLDCSQRREPATTPAAALGTSRPQTKTTIGLPTLIKTQLKNAGTTWHQKGTPHIIFIPSKTTVHAKWYERGGKAWVNTTFKEHRAISNAVPASWYVVPKIKRG